MTKVLRTAGLALASACAATFGQPTTQPTTRAARQPTTYYIANDDHTDYMWTANADTYGRVFVDMIDFHLRLAELTKDNPPQWRNRFNCDGTYWLWEYQHRKSPEQFGRLIEKVKDGTIGVPLNTLVSCYGAQPVEAVIRGMSYAGRLQREYGLTLPLIEAMENQTLPLGLASLMAGCGAEYSWRGVCSCASKLPNKVLADRPAEMYWYAGHDGGRVLMKWYSVGPMGRGTYTEAGSPVAAIDLIEKNADEQRRLTDNDTGKPFDLIGLFGYGGDDLARKTGVLPPPPIPKVPLLPSVVSSGYQDHFPTLAMRLDSPTRKVVVSNEIDFFKAFADRYGKGLPTQRVTYGNEWDLYSASMSETSARVRRAVEKLRSADLLATLVGLKYPKFVADHADTRQRADNALGLYWEHDWTADGPVSRGERAAWQDLQAQTIDSYVESVYAEGLIRLGGMIPQPDKANRFYVLNPLGWARSDVADYAYKGSTDVHVRDVTSGRDVPSQFVKTDGVSRLRVWAEDVPAAGYKVYEILPGKGEAVAAPVSANGDTIENAAVKVTLDRDGAIRSLVDKSDGTELAREVNGLKLNDFAREDDSGDAVKVVNAGPVSVTLQARSEAVIDHVTRVTLYRGGNRVDVQNYLNANFADVRYWAFGFNLDGPTVRTEEVGAINVNRLKKDGGDYADTHARYDHVTLGHFADITRGDGTKGVTLSNADLSFAKLGASTATALDATTPQINVLAGGQVDGGSLGIPAQNGQTHFLQRFALVPHGKYDPAAAMRASLEHQNPLVAGRVLGKPAEAYPGDTYALVSCDNPDVMLWAVKPSDDGMDGGVVTRWWNVADAGGAAKVTFTPGVAAANATTHLETQAKPLTLDAGGAVPVEFARQQIRTVVLTPKK